MDAFVRDLYEFCPDLVDQGTGCLHEMIEMMEETGEQLTPELKKFIKGVDFSDENYGLEILMRELLRKEKRQAVVGLSSFYELRAASRRVAEKIGMNLCREALWKD